MKFGEALANIKKLELTGKNAFELPTKAIKLITAKVTEGRLAPLEQNMMLVELNRLRSLREKRKEKWKRRCLNFGICSE